MKTLLAIALFASSAAAQRALTIEPFASGLTDPGFIGQAPGFAERGRLWVAERRVATGGGFEGRVRIVDLSTGEVRDEPVLSVPVAGGVQQGLLGLAFPIDFASNPRVYINYTDPWGDTRIEEHAIVYDAGQPFAGAIRRLLTIAQPFADNNGGSMDFSPFDGYLYIATGDGGSAGDPAARAQDITDELLGKILRIDVASDDFPADPERNYAIPADNPLVGVVGDDEIWAWGLRNPAVAISDGGSVFGGNGSGDLWIVDPGERSVDEVNRNRAVNFNGLLDGGQNYGWSCAEGDTILDDQSCPDPSVLTFPVAQITLLDNRCGLIGGVPYVGCDLVGYFRDFFVADACSGEFFRVEVRDFTGTIEAFDITADLGAAGSPLAFGEDGQGEMYLAYADGTVARIVLDGLTNECQNNCQSSCSPADIAKPCTINDLSDVTLFIDAFLIGHPIADTAAPQGIIDLSDIDTYIGLFLAGCP